MLVLLHVESTQTGKAIEKKQNIFDNPIKEFLLETIARRAL